LGTHTPCEFIGIATHITPLFAPPQGIVLLLKSMANEALSIDLTDPDVAEAFAEAGVGDQCIIKATIASKDEGGLTASVDSAEYDGYEYTIDDGQESKTQEKPKMMNRAGMEEGGPEKPKGKGLVVMVGIGKPKK